jgi:CRISPR/Cas system-associated protein Cas10 (large subunit of type III CRISPR-Cas system)
MRWNARQKVKDPNGLEISNYPDLYPFFHSQFNASSGFYLLANLKELETDKKLK